MYCFVDLIENYYKIILVRRNIFLLQQLLITWLVTILPEDSMAATCRVLKPCFYYYLQFSIKNIQLDPVIFIVEDKSSMGSV